MDFAAASRRKSRELKLAGTAIFIAVFVSALMSARLVDAAADEQRGRRGEAGEDISGSAAKNMLPAAADRIMALQVVNDQPRTVGDVTNVSSAVVESNEGPTGPLPLRQNYPGTINSKIVDGSPVFPEDRYPYQSLVYDAEGLCGGTLVAPNVILTAGHCKDPKGVRVGGYALYTGDECSVVHVEQHPFYSPELLNYDFQLLRLADGCNLTQTPVMLYDGKCGPLPADEGLLLHTFGWGSTTSGGELADVLMQAEVYYVPNDDCGEWPLAPIEGSPPVYGSFITESMICAGGNGRDSCRGDSGGPLILRGADSSRDLQVGVVSWGRGCGFYPGVYASVAVAHRWISACLDHWGTSLRQVDCADFAHVFGSVLHSDTVPGYS